MKKATATILATACIALALALTGCGSAQQSSESGNDQQQQQQAQQQTAQAGEKVAMSTKKGDMNVTVEGFEVSDEYTTEYREYGMLKDGEYLGALLLTVENVSYEDPDISPSGTVSLCDYVSAKMDGVTPALLRESTDYGTYEVALGGYMHSFKPGDAQKVCILYKLSAVPSQVVTSVNGVQVETPVTAD